MQVIAEKLTMHFNDAGRVIEVFQNLSFQVPSGTSLAIVGESGIGKTTLLYILGGLEKPVEGQVVIGETDITALRAGNDKLTIFRGKKIGFIFQFHYLFPEFDALENVAMPLLIQGVDKSVAMGRAEELLHRVGLAHRLSHRPGTLSGGEQQRVSVARALCARPGVILADEPTGNLDVKTAAQVNELLLEIQREEKITLIVVTHSLELAAKMGRVVELTAQGLK